MKDLTEVKAKARERLKGICRVCAVCDGTGCRGLVPGIGGVGTGTSFTGNIEVLGNYKVNLRVIHGQKVQNTSCTTLGQQLEFPILVAPMAGVKVNFASLLEEEELARALVLGARMAGTIALTGDAPDVVVFAAGLQAIKEAGGIGIPIIKPRSNEEIIQRIHQAEEIGALAIGIDLDAAALINMTKAGQVVEPKTIRDLQEITRATSLPVILKGVMTVEDALVAAESGVSIIVVSNHGGRALDHLPATAEVLPKIADTLKNRLEVWADGGIRSGIDVLKMLALGADIVLVGRPILIAAFGGGADGVALQLKALAEELVVAMRLTGCGSLPDVGKQVIWQHLEERIFTGV